MRIILALCRTCESPCIHRVVPPEVVPEDLRGTITEVDLLYFEDYEYLICSSCQRWTLLAWTHVNPGAEARRRFDVYLTGKPGGRDEQ